MKNQEEKRDHTIPIFLTAIMLSIVGLLMLIENNIYIALFLASLSFAWSVGAIYLAWKNL